METRSSSAQGETDRLRTALLHWKRCDAEYEILKEEITALASDASLERLRDALECNTISRTELDELLGLGDERLPKSRSSIVNQLERRIDYVTRNIATLDRRLATLDPHSVDEALVSNADFSASNEDCADIVEELDKDENVVSYRLQRPQDAEIRLKNALGQAGLLPLASDGKKSSNIPTTQSPSKPDAKSSPLIKISETVVEPMPQAAPVFNPASALDSIPKGNIAPLYEPLPKLPNPEIVPPPTIVDQIDQDPLSDATASPTSSGPTYHTPETPQISRAARRLDEIMKMAKAQEDVTHQPPVYPENESPEEAALRRRMVEYGMAEVGAVVAQLDLLEGSSSDEDDEVELTGSEDDDGTSSDDDEDMYGRSTRSAITDSYQRHMMRLQKRLGIIPCAPHEPDTEDAGVRDDSEKDEGIGRIVVKPEVLTLPTSVDKKASTTKHVSPKSSIASVGKSVRFAETLEIAPDQDSNPSCRPSLDRPRSKKDVLGVNAVRSAPPEATPQTTTRKASRFKQELASAKVGLSPKSNNSHPRTLSPKEVPAQFQTRSEPPLLPLGPKGKPLSDTIIERELLSAPVLDLGHDNDSLDPTALGQEMSEEYHRLRRRLINRAGGFLAPNESAVQPLNEDEGGPPRVSRFLAGRLSKT